MSEKRLDELGDLQRNVIEMVWQLGEATVHQVRDELCRKKKLAYTTILTAMQNLEKSGWLKHRSEGKTYIYLPTRTKEDANKRSLKNLMHKVYNGNAFLMFQHLMKQSSLSDNELKELKSMINDKRKNMK